MNSEQKTDKKINAEWRFLARRVLDLCDEINSRNLGGGSSSESRRQLAAFVERRETAMALLQAASQAPASGPGRYLSRLRRLVSGLECSRAFFAPPPGNRESA